MQIQPNSVIKLCSGVPIDSSYKDTIYFESRSAQKSYFDSKVSKTMDKAEFDGHHVLVDSFGDLDIERLNILFADDPTYTEIGQAELEALDAIPCVLVDSDWL